MAFAQGTMGGHAMRDVVIPPSPGHHLHVYLNVLTDQLRGTVTAQMLAANGAVLRTESVVVSLPDREVLLPRRRPRPLGIVNLLFPVAVDLDWGAVVAVGLSPGPLRP